MPIDEIMGGCVSGESAIEHIPKFIGNIWYVDGSVAVSGSGAEPSLAFQTITEAITTATAGDAIAIKSGTYDEGGLVLNKTLQLWGQPSVTITNSTLGTVLTVSANSCYVKGIRLTQTGQIGVHVTGQKNIFEDCPAGTAPSVGWDIDGGGNWFINCRAGNASVTGWDIGANGNKLVDCTALGSLGNTRGFYLTAGVRCELLRCISGSNATAGFETAAGVAYCIFKDCTSGAGDGDRVDAGEWNAWPGFVDRLRREGHEHEYPPPAGEGVASDPITINNTVTDDSGAGPWSDQNYWGDVVRVIPPGTLAKMWTSYGLYINAGTAADVQPWQVFFTNYHYCASRSGGNIWDYQETVLTVDDATPIEVGDKVWITGTGHLDGEICNVVDVTGNVVTITSETRASADTGLKYDYTGNEIMYVIYRAGNRILHGYDGDYSAGSAKDSLRFVWAASKLIEANGGMIMRMANATDAQDSSFDVRAIYVD